MPTKKGRGRPRKVTSSKAEIVKPPKQKVSSSRLRQMIRSIRWTESYTSLLMGVIVVIVGVLFVVSFLKETHHIQQTSSTSTMTVSNTPAATITIPPSELKPSSLQKTYTVKPGDDLWHIAEKYYKSGYNWTDIAKANNLSDPSMIFSGNSLVIPTVAPQIATITISPTPEVGLNNTTTIISGNTYTVQKGDSLWDISVRAYADGYQWTKIAGANNLSNPNLIFSGNVLKIPR